jgi:hypothetical protein
MYGHKNIQYFMLVFELMYAAVFYAFTFGLYIQYVSGTVAPWTVDNPFSYALNTLPIYGLFQLIKLFAKKINEGSPSEKKMAWSYCTLLCTVISLVVLVCLFTRYVAYSEATLTIFPYFLAAALSI